MNQAAGRQVNEAVSRIKEVEAQIGTVLVGQRQLVRSLLVALLADGHCLLEGLPGLAKTTAVKALATTLDASFRRLQFTPDLLPADIIGTRIYEQGSFSVRKGPIFAQIVLADEINRAPAKVQSALLEAMEERQVTIGEETFALPNPFLVLATQNPIEQEGTYPLPEAQTDRFLMKIRVRYPSAEEERQVLERHLLSVRPQPQKVIDIAALHSLREASRSVFIDDRLKDYIVRLVRATREPKAGGVPRLEKMIAIGASPRAVLGLAVAAKAQALCEGNGYVTPQDIKTVAPDILRHRLIPSYEAEAEEMDSDALVASLLEHVQVP